MSEGERGQEREKEGKRGSKRAKEGERGRKRERKRVMSEIWALYILTLLEVFRVIYKTPDIVNENSL